MNLVYSLDGAKLGKVKCPNPLKFLKCTRIILKERGKNTQNGWGFSDLWILIDSFLGGRQCTIQNGRSSPAKEIVGSGDTPN